MTMRSRRIAWVEDIRCPECGDVFPAEVSMYAICPFPAYVAECPKCGHIITESEWDKVGKGKQ